MTQHDVIIVGGGHSGLLAAIVLAGQGRSVAVIEPQPLASIQDARSNGRTLALLAGSAAELDKLGVWSSLAEVAAPIASVEVIDSSSGSHVTYGHEDAPKGRPFGYGFENHELRRLLLGLFLERVGPDALIHGRLAGFGRDLTSVTVTVEDGPALRGALLVGADGRGSLVRSLARIGVERWTYPQAALGFVVAHEQDNHGAVLERLRPGGPLATLPLGTHRTGITWVEPPEQAEELARGPSSVLLAALGEGLDDALGRMSLASPVGLWPLSGQHARRYVAPRLALVGDAAHGVHPIHAQGFNMGVADVAGLAAAIGNAPDPGAAAILRAYERSRRSANTRTIWLTDGLARLFSNELVPLVNLRGAALDMLDRVSPLRRFAISRGMEH